MGFLFNIFTLFVLLPVTGILLIAWLVSGKRWMGIMLGSLWLGFVGLSLLIGAVRWLSSKTILDHEDYHGSYVIDRDYFQGEQADWQYNHYRFDITEQDSILFYVTDKEKILTTYRGTISTTSPYGSARLRINMAQPTHHILASNPTTYRSAWNFYLVFHSPRFHNVFFRKGQWKPIE